MPSAAAAVFPEPPAALPAAPRPEPKAADPADRGFEDRLAEASSGPKPPASDRAGAADPAGSPSTETDESPSNPPPVEVLPAEEEPTADGRDAAATEEAAVVELEEAFRFDFRTDLAPPPASVVGSSTPAAATAAGTPAPAASAPAVRLDRSRPGGGPALPGASVDASAGPTLAPTSAPGDAFQAAAAGPGRPTLAAAASERPPAETRAAGGAAVQAAPQAAGLSAGPTGVATAAPEGAASPPGSIAPERPAPGPAPIPVGTVSPPTQGRMDAANTSLEAGGEDLNTARIGRGLRSAVHQGGGAVTLRLTPEALGTVRVQLDMSGGRVAAHFQAETSAARELLQQQLPQLRASLESQGLAVDRLSAGPAGSSPGSGAQEQNTGSRDSSSRPDGSNASANDGRSRGQHRGRDEPDAPPTPDADREPSRSFADLFRR